MKILVLITFLVVMVFGDIGKIIAVKGDVSVERMGKTIYPKQDFILDTKDIVITKKQSRAMIEFNDKTLITLGKNSKLVIENYIYDRKSLSEARLTLKFGKGIFRTISGKIGKINRKNFKLKTKTTSIGIRGSDGTTIVNNKGDVKHVTKDGEFILTNIKTGKKVFVPEGYTGITSENNIKSSKTNNIDLNQISSLSKLFQKDLEEKEEEKTEEKEEEIEEDVKEEILKVKKEKVVSKKKIIISNSNSNEQLTRKTTSHYETEKIFDLYVNYDTKSVQAYAGINYNFYGLDELNAENKNPGINAGFLFNNDSKFLFSFYRDVVDKPEARYKVENIDLKYGYSFNNNGIRKGFILDAGLVRTKIDTITDKEVDVTDEDTGLVSKILVKETNQAKSWYFAISAGYEYKVGKNYIIDIRHNINAIQFSRNTEIKDIRLTTISFKYLFD